MYGIEPRFLPGVRNWDSVWYRTGTNIKPGYMSQSAPKTAHPQRWTETVLPSSNSSH